MGRAPCCEKMGLNKGPWTPEEDRRLIAHIQKHGHANWRALPKQAGLLRCGKSCRLRWINYLRPDIKRGNFSIEEEETIIKLHEMLGNRWSTIAARLPGRTDNEIKNMWHTHLKKRVLKRNQANNSDTKQNHNPINKCDDSSISRQSESDNSNSFPTSSGSRLMSPQPSSSDLSSATTGETNQYMDVKDEQTDSFENFPEIDECFWTDPFSDENSSIMQLSDFGGIIDEFQLQSQFTTTDQAVEQGYDYSPKTDDSMAFWYNILLNTGEESTLPFF